MIIKKVDISDVTVIKKALQEAGCDPENQDEESKALMEEKGETVWTAEKIVT
jgi:hypothetical protein